MGTLLRKAAIITTDTVVGGKAAEHLEKVTDPNSYRDEINVATAISELKAQFQAAVNSALDTQSKGRVVVFVDDLDRLQPAKAVELLEILKVFLDCDNCVYVLAIDYEVV